MSRLISVIGLALLLAGCAYYGPGYGYYGSGYYSYGSGYGGYPGVNSTEQTASPAATYGG